MVRKILGWVKRSSGQGQSLGERVAQVEKENEITKPATVMDKVFYLAFGNSKRGK